MNFMKIQIERQCAFKRIHFHRLTSKISQPRARPRATPRRSILLRLS